MRIALLAERLRVEERLLTAAFESRGHDVQLVSPSSLHVVLAGGDGVHIARGGSADSKTLSADLALDRGAATLEGAALGALAMSAGAAVVNRPATTRLLADRLAAVRHLAFADIPLASTIVSFGESATFDAIETLGYPVLLKSITADHGYPTAIIEDKDAAEAIVEHRVTLGAERGVLVQQFVTGSRFSVRLVVVGQETVAVERRELRGWRPSADAAYEAYASEPAALHDLGRRVTERLGSGTYSIEVVESDHGPVVVGVENLVNFRSVSTRGIDIAGAIADFALLQTSVLSEGKRVG